MYIDRFKRIKHPYLDIVYFGLIARILDIVKNIMLGVFLASSNTPLGPYSAAFASTMLLTKIIADAITISMIPPFQEMDRDEGFEGRMKLTNDTINAMVIFGIIVVGLSLVLTKPIIGLANPSLNSKDLAEVMELFKYGIPIVIFHFLRATAGGYLQSDHRFTYGAKSGIVNSLIFIIYLLIYKENITLKGLMIVGVIAVIVQMGIMMNALVSDGYRYSLDFDLKNEKLKKVFVYLIPVTIVGILNFILGRVDTKAVAGILDADMVGLKQANNIIGFIRDIIIVGLVTVMFPVISESFVLGDKDELQKNSKFGIYLLMIVILPVSAALFALSKPLINIIYNSQNLSSVQISNISMIMKINAIGIIGSMVLLLVNRMYYATRKFSGAIGMGIGLLISNIILNKVFGGLFGLNGIVLSSVVSTFIIAGIGLREIDKEIEFMNGRIYAKNIFRICIALIIMVLFLIITTVITNLFVSTTLTGNVIKVFVVGFVGMTAYIISIIKIGHRMNIQSSRVR